MYEQFYGLRDKPFSLTPNPRFVFYSQQYHEAEGQLIYGINNREGFMLVTGQPGTGKTTLCRDLIEKLDHEKCQSALIFNPFLSGMEMLGALLNEFGINAPANGTRKELLDRLNQFLLAQLALGKSCVAIFDEAQHLSPEFLEQIRVLSNLETDQEKLIQIILVGQPELLDRIRTPQMAQLDQRVSIRCTLTDLDKQETDRYIHHRLNVAGARGQVRFSPRAVDEIYRGSHGVPRLINLICDRALLAGYASQTRDIQPPHVAKAIAALRGEDAQVSANTAEPTRSWSSRAALIAAGVVLVAGLSAAAMTILPRLQAAAPDDAAYARATTAASAADAERELTSFVARYPASTHFDEALLRLSRLELSRGDRTAAIEHLGQLTQRSQAGAHGGAGMLLTALALLDGNDTTAACQNVSPELTTAVSSDSTLSHQLTTVSSVCAGRNSPVAGAPLDSTTRARDSLKATPASKKTGNLKLAANDSLSRRRAPATPAAAVVTKP